MKIDHDWLYIFNSFVEWGEWWKKREERKKEVNASLHAIHQSKRTDIYAATPCIQFYPFISRVVVIYSSILVLSFSVYEYIYISRILDSIALRSTTRTTNKNIAFSLWCTQKRQLLQSHIKMYKFWFIIIHNAEHIEHFGIVRFGGCECNWFCDDEDIGNEDEVSVSFRFVPFFLRHLFIYFLLLLFSFSASVFCVLILVFGVFTFFFAAHRGTGWKPASQSANNPYLLRTSFWIHARRTIYAGFSFIRVHAKFNALFFRIFLFRRRQRRCHRRRCSNIRIGTQATIGVRLQRFTSDVQTNKPEINDNKRR